MLDKNDIKVRKANLSDCETIYKWVNKKDSLLNKLYTNKKIKFSDHKNWYSNILNDKNSYIWIIFFKKKKVGQVRMEYKKDLFHEVDIYLDEQFREKGIAKTSFQLVESRINVKNLKAKIKKNNISSFTFFENIGFKLINQNSKIWVFEKKYL